MYVKLLYMTYSDAYCVFYSVVSAEEKMELNVFYAMQCKTCYSAFRVSVAGV